MNNLILFPSQQRKTKITTPWLNHLARLHKDGHKKFNYICGLARELAKETQLKNHWDELTDNLEAIKQDPFWFNVMTEEIEKVYKKIYVDAEIISIDAIREGV